MPVRLSIIIPTLNEEYCIEKTLSSLQYLRAAGHEIIIVDGGSKDRTIELAKPMSDLILRSASGRARQMNTGTLRANGELVLFLHADTVLPENSDQLIIAGLTASQRNWGRFDIKLSGKSVLFRIIERMMNWRSRLSGIATGDQAIFVQKKLFTTIGGYQEIPLMEDIALCKCLKKHSRPLCLKTKAITSSRRWEQHGIFHTVCLMWYLRLAFALGVSPWHLARSYSTS